MKNIFNVNVVETLKNKKDIKTEMLLENFFWLYSKITWNALCIKVLQCLRQAL